MIGTGSLVLTHQSGWSACREAVMGMEFDVRPDKTAKRTLVVSMTGLYDCVGDAKGEVKGMIKLDEGNKVAFIGQLQGRSRIEIHGETNNDFETIIKEIEKWQEHYRVS